MRQIGLSPHEAYMTFGRNRGKYTKNGKFGDLYGISKTAKSAPIQRVLIEGAKLAPRESEPFVGVGAQRAHELDAMLPLFIAPSTGYVILRRSGGLRGNAAPEGSTTGVAAGSRIPLSEKSIGERGQLRWT
jgi:hypothetical protein